MNTSNPPPYLNEALGRWLKADVPAPTVDCGTCVKEFKCCAFQPFVANFLIGGWLESGRELPPMTNGFWHPLGFVPSAGFREKHGRESANRDLLCGFWDQGRCSLWSFRPGECSTYFCDSAPASRVTLSERSFAVEVASAQMALIEAGFTGAEVGLSVDDLNEGRAWSGRAVDLGALYRKAWTWSRGIETTDVHAWLENA